MKIATTTGDFREYLDWDDVAGATRLLAQCGFRHIDVNMYHDFHEGSALCSDNWREWAEGIRQAWNEAGVNFVQAHGSDGSFAVAGLIAKPTVDILLEVDPAASPDAVRQIAGRCGYTVRAETMAPEYRLDRPV